jgi:hypothetical protein
MSVREQMRRLEDDQKSLWQPTLLAASHALDHLRNLSREVERLSNRYETGRPPKSPLDPEEVWAKWRQQGFEFDSLTSRELRSLCVSPPTALRSQLVRVLGSHPESLGRLSNISGVIHAYFTHWRPTEQPEVIENLLKSALIAPGMLNRGRVIHMWRNSSFLFSADAAGRVAKDICQRARTPKEVLSSYFIDSTTRLAQKAREASVDNFIESLLAQEKAISEYQALEDLAWLRQHLLTEELDAGRYRDAVASLIASELPIRFTTFQQSLTQEIYASPRLGDPRLSGCAANWRLVSPEAKARFLSWLAKETLQFFFDTIVPANDENRRRAEFWKQFAKTHGKIRDFQVAVSSDDVIKIHRSRANLIPAYARIIAAKSVASSAFLMVFKGYNGVEYVIVEFSETGCAAQIYRRDVFEAAGVRLHARSFRQKEDLRRLDRIEDRILHQGAWEFRAIQLLARLGIRP